MLAEGSLAPDFVAQTDTEETIKLSDYRGKIVVLYFFPAAHTLGCTAQACGFRDIYYEFLELDAVVIGVSIDEEGKQHSFRTKNNLPFPLIIDINKEVSRLYGGIGRMGKANRITFLIDKEGNIKRTWKLTGILAQINLHSHAQKVKQEITKLFFSGV